LILFNDTLNRLRAYLTHKYGIGVDLRSACPKYGVQYVQCGWRLIFNPVRIQSRSYFDSLGNLRFNPFFNSKMELVLSICGKHPSVPRNIFRTVFYSISPCKQFSSHFAKFQRSSHGLPSRSLATQAVCLFSFPQKSSLTEELGSRRGLISRDSWCLSTRSYSFSGAPKDHRKKP
jgi:hypothetical protein